jgi:hypothetical protein
VNSLQTQKKEYFVANSPLYQEKKFQIVEEKNLRKVSSYFDKVFSLRENFHQFRVLGFRVS